MGSFYSIEKFSGRGCCEVLKFGLYGLVENTVFETKKMFTALKLFADADFIHMQMLQYSVY